VELLVGGGGGEARDGRTLDSSKRTEGLPVGSKRRGLLRRIVPQIEKSREEKEGTEVVREANKIL